jgi:hypothetical protein
MKVHAHEQAAPEKSTPAQGQYQRVLQQLGTSLASPRRALPPGSATPPTAGKPLPQPLPAGRPTQPQPVLAGRPTQPPLSGSRLPGTAVAVGPVLTTPRTAVATPENLGQARQAMNTEAQRLRVTRTEAQAVSHERTEHRVSELISRELARELHAEPAPAPTARAATPLAEPTRVATPAEGPAPAGEARLTVSTSSTASTEAPGAQVQVRAAMELIEKIELFVRSQRPALRLSLGGALAATVEVERTGPREVSLRIQGRDGPLAQQELTRIREGLEARGLRLRSLRAE